MKYMPVIALTICAFGAFGVALTCAALGAGEARTFGMAISAGVPSLAITWAAGYIAARINAI